MLKINLFSLNPSLRQSVATSREFVPINWCSRKVSPQQNYIFQTAWHLYRENWSTWLIFSGKMSQLQKIKFFFQFTFFLNLKSAGKYRKWLTAAFWGQVKQFFCYAFANHFFWRCSCESGFPVTVFPYFVKSNKYHRSLQFCHHLSCIAGQVAAIFMFTSNQTDSHSFTQMPAPNWTKK